MIDCTGILVAGSPNGIFGEFGQIFFQKKTP